MNLPTVKRLVDYGFDLEVAKKIRRRMEKYRDDYPWGNRWPVHTMKAIADIMGEGETQEIAAGHNENSPRILYVNTGDSYGTTILFYRGNFHVGDWGSVVERGNYASC